MSPDCHFHEDTQHFDAERDALHGRVVERRRVAAVDAATVLIRLASGSVWNQSLHSIDMLLALEDDIRADPSTLLDEFFKQLHDDRQAITDAETFHNELNGHNPCGLNGATR